MAGGKEAQAAALKTPPVSGDSCKRLTGVNSSQRYLTDEQRLFILSRIADFATYGQILLEFEKEFGFIISEETIHRYKTSPKWRPVWKEIRDRGLQDLSHIAMSHKAKRLVMLQRVYDAAMTWRHSGYAKKELKEELTGPDGNVLRDKTGASRTRTSSTYDRIMKRDLKTAALAVEYARREMEGDEAVAPGMIDSSGQAGVIRTPERITEQEWDAQQAQERIDHDQAG